MLDLHGYMIYTFQKFPTFLRHKHTQQNKEILGSYQQHWNVSLECCHSASGQAREHISKFQYTTGRYGMPCCRSSDLRPILENLLD